MNKPVGSQKRKSPRQKTAHMPSREEIVQFIAQNPTRSGKRDIAKAFNLKGDGRIILKAILKEMQDEGLLEKRRKQLINPNTIPPVGVIDIIGRDSDGALTARPAQWEGNSPAPLITLKRTRSTAGPAPGIGDRVLAYLDRDETVDDGSYLAKTIRVLPKRDNTMLGVLRNERGDKWFIEPVQRKQDILFIDERSIGEGKANDLVIAKITSKRGSHHPRGEVLSVVGALQSQKAVSLIALHEHDIPFVFPDEVISDAQSVLAISADKLEPLREDWRTVPLITIDPADAKDHDDAVFAQADDDPANPGGHIITVAIADVAAYVRNGSALDAEALKRSNSVYFPDRVVPMLPERISNDLCSLREGEDRPALAVCITVDARGNKIRHSFHRILMRSHAKLSYQQAQSAIDGQSDDTTAPILDTILTPLWAAYEAMSIARDARSPLALDLPERRLILRQDGTVERVIIPPRLDAHRLIEECMIQANVCAAQTLEAKKQALIYRIHDTPSLAKQETLRDFLKTIGVSLARGAQLRPQQFNSILAQARGTDHEAMVSQVVLRSQAQAIYSPDNIGHFGLNLLRYAHFTSPIRRYADLIVHRALIYALGLGSDGLTDDEAAHLTTISETISNHERRAMAAERDTTDRLIAHHLATRVGDTFEGSIAGVTKSGLFVQLPQFGADGFVPVSTLGDDYYHFDEAALALVGERRSKGFRLGDKVEVKLVNIAALAGSITFEMVTLPRAMPQLTSSRHKARSRFNKRPPPRKATRK